MKIIQQSWSFEGPAPDGKAILGHIEAAGRTCYQSEPRGDSEAFVKKIIQRGHLSVIEHASVSVRLVTDRGVTHELVRHRLCAFSQESTRYCNYSGDKFGKEIAVILPVWFDDATPQPLGTAFDHWRSCCATCEDTYFRLLDMGQSPQQARSVLPNSLKTEIVVTANLREWRHVFSLRCSKAAHPQIRALMLDVLRGFQDNIPVIFDDFGKE